MTIAQLAKIKMISIVVGTVTALLAGVYTSYQFGYDSGYNLGKLESVKVRGDDCHRKLRKCQRELEKGVRN
jgi:hypothetical protein